jgi:hypothetical protein
MKRFLNILGDEQQKKNDLYLLKAGYCFGTRFEGARGD